MLTDDEKLDLWRAVSEAVDVPVIAGTGTNDTAETIELTRRAADTGVGRRARRQAVLQPAAAGRHRGPLPRRRGGDRAAGDALRRPGRTGRAIAHDVLVRLVHEVPNIVALRTRPATRPRRLDCSPTRPSFESTAATTR